MTEKPYIVPIFLTRAGCRHHCAFCNAGKIAGGETADWTEKKFIAEVEKHLSRPHRKRTTRQIAFYGGNFTGIEETAQRRLLHYAKRYVDGGLVDSIRVSTRPDCIDNEKLALLKEFSVETVELGVQSFDNSVLAAAGRGHTALDVYRAMELLKGCGFRTGIQLMPGLPGDTRERSIYSADEAVRLMPDDARIYPCVVLAGTRLEAMYRSGEFTPLDLEEAVDISAQMYSRFTANGISVIRIGLHPLENSSSVIDGPYHTAMGFMVKSRYRRNVLDSLLAEHKPGHGSVVNLAIPRSFCEEYIGLRRGNMDYLKSRYSLASIEYHAADTDRPFIIA